MTIDEVRNYVGGSRPVHWTTIYDWVRDRGFPPPIKLGANTSRWKRSQIDKWIDDQQREQAHG